MRMPANTKKWKKDFLDELSQHGIVGPACIKAGVAKRVALDEKAKSPKFSQQWDDAVDLAVDRMEAIALQRALAGSDAMMRFLLGSVRPEKFHLNTDKGLARIEEALDLDRRYPR